MADCKPIGTTSGNSYEIENIGVDDAKVVFMQAREVRVVDDPSADAAES